MPDKVRFDAEKHRYYINEEQYPSVTTILGVIDKSAALMGWAVKVSVAYIGKNLDRLRGSLTESGASAILTQAKQEANRLKEEAADVGTLIHDICDRIDKGETIPLDLLDDKVRNGVQAYLKWCKDVKWEFLQGEFIIYDTDHKYAGMVDKLGMVNGKLALVDIKTGKAIYPEMLLQLSAYANAYHKLNPDEQIEEFYIIKLDKDDGSFEVHKIEEDMGYLFNVFLGAKKIYDWRKKKC
jgi:hypothetical protein